MISQIIQRKGGGSSQYQIAGLTQSHWLAHNVTFSSGITVDGIADEALTTNLRAGTDVGGSRSGMYVANGWPDGGPYMQLGPLNTKGYLGAVDWATRLSGVRTPVSVVFLFNNGAVASSVILGCQMIGESAAIWIFAVGVLISLQIRTLAPAYTQKNTYKTGDLPSNTNAVAVVTYDGTTARTFINGAETTPYSLQQTSDDANTMVWHTFNIGSGGTGGTYAGNFKLAEAHVYLGCLTTEQVVRISHSALNRRGL